MRELSLVVVNVTDSQCSTFPFMLFTTAASSSYLGNPTAIINKYYQWV